VGNLEKTLLIVNPSAGGTRAGRVWQRLQASVPELAHIRKIVSTDLAASMTQLEDHLADGIERLIVLGGDGTASLAAHREPGFMFH